MTTWPDHKKLTRKELSAHAAVLEMGVDLREEELQNLTNEFVALTKASEKSGWVIRAIISAIREGRKNDHSDSSVLAHIKSLLSPFFPDGGLFEEPE